MIWPDETYYEGEWKDDKFEGEGSYLWVNGSKYVGNWHKGQRSG